MIRNKNEHMQLRYKGLRAELSMADLQLKWTDSASTQRFTSWTKCARIVTSTKLQKKGLRSVGSSPNERPVSTYVSSIQMYTSRAKLSWFTIKILLRNLKLCFYFLFPVCFQNFDSLKGVIGFVGISDSWGLDLKCFTVVHTFKLKGLKKNWFRDYCHLLKPYMFFLD